MSATSALGTSPPRRPLRAALALVLVALVAQLGLVERGAAAPAHDRPAILSPAELDALTIPEIQDRIESRALSSFELTLSYLARVREVDDELSAVITVNPLALLEAATSDVRRHFRGPRSALEGVPVLLKDNIDTGDRLPPPPAHGRCSAAVRPTTPVWSSGSAPLAP